MRIKFKVTNENIKLRFDAEKKKNPDYGIKQFCEQFDIIRNLAYKWMSSVHRRFPNATNKCAKCGKTKADIVDEWINDGTLRELVKKGKL